MPAAPWTSGSTITAATSLAVLAPAAPTSCGDVAGLDLQGVEQQRAVERVEEVDAADRHRADRVAVVALRRQTNSVRRGSPRLRCHCWKAIFSATSTAVEPVSE